LALRLLDAGVDQPLGRRLLRQVAGQGQRGAAGRGDAGGRALEPDRLDVAEDDARALAGQELGDLPAQTAGGARHHGDAVTDAGHAQAGSSPTISLNRPKPM